MREVVGELATQHARWSDAKGRLWEAPPVEPKPLRERPVSPFLRPPAKPKHKLFLAAIVQVDDQGREVPDETSPVPLWKQIARQVAAKHKVSVKDLVSPRRDRPSVLARHEAFWRCKKETTMSLPLIGRRFGGRDHTTVLHGIKAHARRMLEAENG
jgi:hypothetical protein